MAIRPFQGLGGPPAGRAACGRLLPFWTPHALRLWSRYGQVIVRTLCHISAGFRMFRTTAALNALLVPILRLTYFLVLLVLRISFLSISGGDHVKQPLSSLPSHLFLTFQTWIPPPPPEPPLLGSRETVWDLLNTAENIPWQRTTTTTMGGRHFEN
jgi:hypothetical protein